MKYNISLFRISITTFLCLVALLITPFGSFANEGVYFDTKTGALFLPQVDAGNFGMYNTTLQLVDFRPITFLLTDYELTTGQELANYADGKLSIPYLTIGEDVFKLELRQPNLEKFRFEIVTLIRQAKTNESVKDFWKQFAWNELNPDEQELWVQLGWNEANWQDEQNPPASGDKSWAELTAAEQLAAEQLSYEQASWDGTPKITSFSPTIQALYVDIDADSEEELLLNVINPDGNSGSILYEPLSIAYLMTTQGYGLSDDYWNSLSSTQQASLKNTLVTADLLAADNTDNPTSTVIDLLAKFTETNFPAYSYSGQFDKTSLNVENLASKIMLLTELADGSYTANFNSKVRARNGFNLGGITLDEDDITTTNLYGPSANAEASITENSFTIGAEANLLSVTHSVGDENGSFFAVNSGIGTGYWADLSYGRNDQYGFALDVKPLPVGVALYVSGADVTTLYDKAKGWSIDKYSTTEELAEDAWNNAVNWTEDAIGDIEVTFANSVDDTGVFFERTGKDALLWIDEAGDTLLVGLNDTGSSIKDALTSVGEGLSDAASSVTAKVSSWASNAKSAVKSVWNDTKEAVDKGVDWVCGWLGC